MISGESAQNAGRASPSGIAGRGAGARLQGSGSGQDPLLTGVEPDRIVADAARAIRFF